MPSDMSNKTQQISARGKPQSAMMKEYLARAPETATERLVAQGSDVFKTSIGITVAGKTSLMEVYLNQLVQQAQGGGSHRGSTSSISTF